MLLANKTKFAEFIEFVEDMANYLRALKNEFDHFEADFPVEKLQVRFLESRREEIFRRLDYFFERSWFIICDLSPEEQKEFRDHYIKILYPCIWKGCEFNEYIRAKPLGYDGDYVMMNYIYDYHDRRYYGRTLFSKLINNYTCNIDVALSNIVRKDFFKEEFASVISAAPGTKILSVGSGPAREVTELLEEDGIRNPCRLTLFDFEPKAIEFVTEKLSGIRYDRRKVKINLVQGDLLKVVRKNVPPEGLEDMDFIYISGVFDYFKTRICQRIVNIFFRCLKPGGSMVIANISSSGARYRAYYEYLGDWNMYHRGMDDLMEWMEGVSGPHRFELIDVPRCPNYHFIRLIKP